MAPDTGTIDYETGSVTISNLIITSFASGATSGNLKVFVRPVDPDVTGARNDVVLIRPEDTTITVKELRL